MAGRRKGVGSNQYMDQAPDPQGDAELANQIRQMGYKLPAVPASAIGVDAASQRSNSVLISEMSQAVDGHISAMTSGGYETATQLEAGLQQVSQAEDSLYTKHPSVYGHSMVGAIWWAKSLPADAGAARQAATEPDSVPAQLTRDYAMILADATDQEHLNADDLTAVLSRITENEGKWQGSGHGDERTREQTALTHRHTALSIVCGRSSASPAERAELLELQRHINELQVSRIGL